MSSSYVLRIGRHEIDSNKQRVEGPCVELFTSADHIVQGAGDDAVYTYSITVGCLIKRLEAQMFTLDNCREAIEELKGKMIAEIDQTSELVRRFVPERREEIDQERKYVQALTVETVVDLFRRCQSFEHFAYPELGQHDLKDPELKLLRLVLGGLYVNEPIGFHWYNAYRLLGEVFSEEATFVLDYTDLVHAGYYEADDQPIGWGHDAFVAATTPGALIRGARLEEESTSVEYKEVRSQSPIQSIKGHLRKYVIGFLNAEGGRIVFGVDDSRRVKGITLPYAARDKLRQDLHAAIDNFEPAIAKDAITIEFRPVVHDGVVLDDVFIVEVHVPRGATDEMYFTKSGETWVRVNGATKALTGYELYAQIRKRGHGSP